MTKNSQRGQREQREKNDNVFKMSLAVLAELFVKIFRQQQTVSHDVGLNYTDPRR
jgi:hypothetical protein